MAAREAGIGDKSLKAIQTPADILAPAAVRSTPRRQGIGSFARSAIGQVVMRVADLCGIVHNSTELFAITDSLAIISTTGVGMRMAAENISPRLAFAAAYWPVAN